ncbi:serine/threonine-protein kinase [Streptomyces sp. Tu 3180]|uniref:serine/threonine-protein kinase n=1 Tax=Streptomyces sp. Tu 3180 TaxID=2682611 RepID=UPI00135B3B59|nr:serine/threonine-protein kinase [Streptomyces sp. Tu 3180]KAF3467063.1 serine/threonine protein kinase [Streptomyces sp. Tu 3180]
MSNDGGAGGARGRLIGGRYRLIERIGSGATGTVWRALDERTKREVAVKQPRLPGEPGDERNRRAAHRFYREARAAARVDHPAAVLVHDVVVEEDGPEGPEELGGLPWIVMELVRGESLHQVLERGPLPPAEAARIGLAVLGALRAAHSVGIVHRDVKPANVLLGPPPLPHALGRGESPRRVVLTDFGTAHARGEESPTAGAESIGSLEFVAPERMSGRSAGPASDLWSLGVLLYAAVEGRSPFRRTTAQSTLAAVVTADPPEPERAGELGPLIVRLLAKAPEERPHAEEAAAALEAAAGGRPAPEESAVQSPNAPGAREAGEGTETVRPDSAAGPGPVRTPERIPRSGPAPAAPAPPDASAGTAPATSPTAARSGRRPLRPVPLAALGVLLLAGGLWSATSPGGPDAGTAAGRTARVTPTAGPGDTSGPRGTSGPADMGGPGATAGPGATGWTAHREAALDAVLFLPPGYREAAREDGTGRRPGSVVYEGDGGVRVRLARWDRAPGSPMAQARDAHAGGDDRDGDARTRYTRTSVRGHEAALADTIYGQDGNPPRVLRLVIRTDDGRMYELRVDLPGGTPREKGTAVFRSVRDRLEMGVR